MSSNASSRWGGHPQAPIEALYATGHWLLTHHRYKEAAEVLRAMAMTAPSDERAWLALGACHEAIGQKKLALELYRLASVEAAPAIRCIIASGRVLHALGQDEDACSAFDEACELAVAHDEAGLAHLATNEKDAIS